MEAGKEETEAKIVSREIQIIIRTVIFTSLFFLSFILIYSLFR